MLTLTDSSPDAEMVTVAVLSAPSKLACGSTFIIISLPALTVEPSADPERSVRHIHPASHFTEKSDGELMEIPLLSDPEAENTSEDVLVVMDVRTTIGDCSILTFFVRSSLVNDTYPVRAALASFGDTIMSIFFPLTALPWSGETISQSESVAAEMSWFIPPFGIFIFIFV